MVSLKAIIPVAGLGMHMLPATKAIPKEMLPIVDKPMIQYIVDEIVAAVGNNPFVVVLPDIILDGASADPLRYNLAAMVARFNETGRSQVLAKRMPGDLSGYSVIQTKDGLKVEGEIGRIVEFIEKPDEPQTLDSDLMAVGRYVLSADIWEELERTEPGAWGRIQLTDAIAALAKKQSVDAMLMTGESYDCGKKMGYMQAFVSYGLRNHKEGTKFRESIKKLLA